VDDWTGFAETDGQALFDDVFELGCTVEIFKQGCLVVRLPDGRGLSVSGFGDLMGWTGNASVVTDARLIHTDSNYGFANPELAHVIANWRVEGHNEHDAMIRAVRAALDHSSAVLSPEPVLAMLVDNQWRRAMRTQDEKQRTGEDEPR
jgi:hypothetical protein